MNEPESRCENCDHVNLGAFCSNCGQAHRPLHMHIGDFVRDAFDAVAHLDGKSVRTLVPLLFQPGKLSVDYLLGKRASVVAPLRLYLYVSFFFFWLLAIQSRQHTEQLVRVDVTASPGAASTPSSAPRVPSAQDYATEADDLERKLPTMSGPKHWFTEHLIKVLRKYADGSTEASHAITDALLRTLPKVVFVLVPFCAVLLFALFRRSRKFYIEHLVVALHLHSFLFVAFGLDVFVSIYKDIRALDLILIVLSFFYTFMALRRVYALSKWSTAWRGALVGTAYFALVGMALLATVIWSIAVM